MISTHIRIPIDVKNRLDSLIHEGESIGAIISHLIDYYENKGKVNWDVNWHVNSHSTEVNDEVNKKLTMLIQRVDDISMRVMGLETASKINCDSSDITDYRVQDIEGVLPDTSVPEIGLSDTYDGDEIREVMNDAETFQHPNNEAIMDVMEDQIAQLTQAMNNTRPSQSLGVSTSMQNTVEDNDINSDLPLNPEGWYRQKDIADMMPTSINENSRKSMVSKAVKNGELESNGMDKKKCLIKRLSAIEWLKQFQGNKDDT